MHESVCQQSHTYYHYAKVIRVMRSYCSRLNISRVSIASLFPVCCVTVQVIVQIQLIVV